MYWVKHHLEYLRMWRSAVEMIARAAKDADPTVEVYVIGGAAEGRLTILSDVDVAIVIGRPLSPEEVNKLRKEVYARAVDVYGLPWDYPVELHIMGRDEFREEKAVKISPASDDAGG